MSLNLCFITGNLTADPEFKELKSGAAVTKMRLAVNERFTNRDGKEIERTLFIDVVAWEKTAERCAQYLKKGSRITIEGNLQQDTWEDRDGKTRSKILLRADQVHFLNRVDLEPDEKPRQEEKRKSRDYSRQK